MNSLTRDQIGLMFHKVVDTCEKKLYDPKLNGVNWRINNSVLGPLTARSSTPGLLSSNLCRPPTARLGW